MLIKVIGGMVLNLHVYITECTYYIGLYCYWDIKPIQAHFFGLDPLCDKNVNDIIT